MGLASSSPGVCSRPPTRVNSPPTLASRPPGRCAPTHDLCADARHTNQFHRFLPTRCANSRTPVRSFLQGRKTRCVQCARGKAFGLHKPVVWLLLLGGAECGQCSGRGAPYPTHPAPAPPRTRPGGLGAVLEVCPLHTHTPGTGSRTRSAVQSLRAVLAAAGGFLLASEMSCNLLSLDQRGQICILLP